MSFDAPWLLAGLALLPLLGVAYWRHDARRRSAAAAFAAAPVRASVSPSRAGALRHLPPVLYALALAALIVALARPQAMGTVTVEEATVMLVTDRSGSMRAEDIGGERMGAVKRAGASFLREVPADVRVGLVAFSHEVQLLAAPTTDHGSVGRALQSLEPGGSTAAGDALARALAVVRPPGDAQAETLPAAIVLLSDGESVRGQDPLPIAEQAAELGVPITTVALGTESGVLRSERADGSVREQRVPPDRETLQQIADISGGEYYAAVDSAELERVYEQLGSRAAEREELREISAGFVAGGLALLALGVGAALLFTGRLP